MTDAKAVVIVQPLLPHEKQKKLNVQSWVEEIQNLAKAIALKSSYTEIIQIKKVAPSTLFGKGQVEHIVNLIERYKPEIVIINGTLSPIQHRNLERTLNIKVIDRTALILNIFGERAQTAEGRIQVDMAMLTYQRSRLVKSWTHLERQRGGAGFMGGPGETQLEIDRRLIDEQIARLKKKLEKLRSNRALQKKKREQAPFPIVSLVGYTNSGKSTLFNRLTQSTVFAKDLLFATLDPTLRRLDLGQDLNCILSDTVGFIADLPTELIAAFRATLEQVEEASVILHVRDASSENKEEQKLHVLETLSLLKIKEEDSRLIEVLNKQDQCEFSEFGHISKSSDIPIIGISAITGEGIEALKEQIMEKLSAQLEQRIYSLPAHDGSKLAWLYDHAKVLERDYTENGDVVLKVMISPINQEKFKQEKGG